MPRAKCSCGAKFDLAPHIPKQLPGCGHNLCATCCIAQSDQAYTKVTCPRCQQVSEGNWGLFQSENSLLQAVMDKTSYCSKHEGEKKLFYCYDHEQLICTICCPKEEEEEEEDNEEEDEEEEEINQIQILTHENHKIDELEIAAKKLKESILPQCQQNMQNLLAKAEEKMQFYSNEAKKMKKEAKEVVENLTKTAHETVKLVIAKLNRQIAEIQEKENSALEEFGQKMKQLETIKSKILKYTEIRTNESSGILCFIEKSKKVDKQAVLHEQTSYSINIEQSESFEQKVLPSLLEFQWKVHHAGHPQNSLRIVAEDSDVEHMFNLHTYDQETRTIPRKVDGDSTFVSMTEDQGLLLTGGWDHAKQLVLIEESGVREWEMLTGRYWHGVEYKQGQAYIIGGRNNGVSLQECEVFSQGQSTRLPNHLIKLDGHGTSMTPTSIYTFGGSSRNQNQSGIYQLQDQRWSQDKVRLPVPAYRMKGNYMSEMQSCVLFCTSPNFFQNTLIYDFSSVAAAGENYAQRTGTNYIQHYNGHVYNGRLYNTDGEVLWRYDLVVQEWLRCL